MDISQEKEQQTQSGSKRRAGKGVWTLPGLAFCGVASLILAYLCQTAQLVRVEYEILAKRESMKEMHALRDELELSIQELTSLERVEKAALGRLKMIPPAERKVIEVVWAKQATPVHVESAVPQ